MQHKSARTSQILARLAAKIVAIALISLSLGWFTSPAQATETCPNTGGGWVKVDGVNALTTTVTAPTNKLIAEVCAKSSTNIGYLTLNPAQSSYTFVSGQDPWDGFVNRRGDAQAISHVSYRLVDRVTTPRDASFTQSVAPADCDSAAVLTYSGNNVTFSGPTSPVTGTGASVLVTGTPTANHDWSTDPNDDAARNVFSGTLAGPTGYQSTDPNAPCYRRPIDPRDASFTQSVAPADCDSAAVLTYSGNNVTFSGPTSPVTGTGASVLVTGTPTANHDWSTDPNDDAARNVFSGTLAGPTGYQSTDPNAACYERPPEPPKKVYVCKYVGTPGDDERLQTGQNPIEVSVSSIQSNQWNGITVPAWFSDAYDRSYVLGFVPMSPEPTADDCPGGDEPPPPVKIDVPELGSSDPCGPNNSVWDTQSDGDGLDWTLNGRSLSVVITAANTTFQDGSTSQDFGTPPDSGSTCPPNITEIPLPAPGSSDPCGPGNSVWDSQADGGGLDWTLNGRSLSVVITAANTTFPGGATSKNFGVPPDAGGDCPPPPTCPGGQMDWNSPDEPGCGNPPTPPGPPIPLTEQVEGCDLSEYGDFGPGVITRTGLQEYVWVPSQPQGNGSWVLEDLEDVEWSEWVLAPWSEGKILAECVDVKPEAQVRTVTGERESCRLGGVQPWTDTYTTDWVLNDELEWVLGVESGPVRTYGELDPYSQGELEELGCVEVEGEEGEEGEEDGENLGNEQPDDLEVRGEQAEVPTAVDAGLGADNGPVPAGRRNPLWLLAVVGGLGLMGSAGWRRRTTAVR